MNEIRPRTIRDN
ncbi:unnamed protein product, partial [Rotaria sordida]